LFARSCTEKLRDPLCHNSFNSVTMYFSLIHNFRIPCPLLVIHSLQLWQQQARYAGTLQNVTHEHYFFTKFFSPVNHRHLFINQLSHVCPYNGTPMTTFLYGYIFNYNISGPGIMNRTQRRKGAKKKMYASPYFAALRLCVKMIPIRTQPYK